MVRCEDYGTQYQASDLLERVVSARTIPPETFL